uniref:AP2 domain transcription factor AP2III-1 n=3 Tax=Toxoplasma gondii TaxID=5811 RepID=A0A2T6IUZ7_TOXGO|nr:AP2 domain transcription factor AP2III-1 [Toxoplasma gondii TgCATBr9]
MELSPEARKARRPAARRLWGHLEEAVAKDIRLRSTQQRVEGRRGRLKGFEENPGRRRTRRSAAGRASAFLGKTATDAVESKDDAETDLNGKETSYGPVKERIRRKRGRPRNAPGASTVSPPGPRSRGREAAPTAGICGRREARDEGRRRAKRHTWRRNREAVDGEGRRGVRMTERLRRASLPSQEDSSRDPGSKRPKTVKAAPDSLTGSNPASFTARDRASWNEGRESKAEHNASEVEASDRKSGGETRADTTKDHTLFHSGYGVEIAAKSRLAREHQIHTQAILKSPSSNENTVSSPVPRSFFPSSNASSAPFLNHRMPFSPSPGLLAQPPPAFPEPTSLPLSASLPLPPSISSLHSLPLSPSLPLPTSVSLSPSLPLSPSAPESLAAAQDGPDVFSVSPPAERRDVGGGSFVPEGACISSFSRAQLLQIRLLHMLFEHKTATLQPESLPGLSSDSQRPAFSPASTASTPGSSPPSLPAPAASQRHMPLVRAACALPGREEAKRSFTTTGPPDSVARCSGKADANKSTTSSTRSPTVSLSSSFPPRPAGANEFSSLASCEAPGHPVPAPSLLSVDLSHAPSLTGSPPLAQEAPAACRGRPVSLLEGESQGFASSVRGSGQESEEPRRLSERLGGDEAGRRSFSPLAAAGSSSRGEEDLERSAADFEEANEKEEQGKEDQEPHLSPSSLAPEILPRPATQSSPTACISRGKEHTMELSPGKNGRPPIGLFSATLEQTHAEAGCAETRSRNKVSPVSSPVGGDGAVTTQPLGEPPLAVTSSPLQRGREGPVVLFVHGLEPGGPEDREAVAGMAEEPTPHKNCRESEDASLYGSQLLHSQRQLRDRGHSSAESEASEEDSFEPGTTRSSPQATDRQVNPSSGSSTNAALRQKATGSEPTNSMFEFVEAHRLHSRPSWEAREEGVTGGAATDRGDSRLSVKSCGGLRKPLDASNTASVSVADDARPEKRLSTKDFFRRHYTGPTLPPHPSCALSFGTSSESEGEEGHAKKKKKERRVNVGAADALWQPHFHPHNQEFRVRYRYKGSMRLKTISCARFGREGAKRLTAAFVERWRLTGRRVAAKTHRSRLALVDLPQDTHLLPGYDKKRSGLASASTFSAASCSPASVQPFAHFYFARTPQLGSAPFPSLAPQGLTAPTTQAPQPFASCSSAAPMVPAPSAFPLVSRLLATQAEKVQSFIPKPQVVPGAVGVASAHGVAGNYLALHEATRGTVDASPILPPQSGSGQFRHRPPHGILPPGPQTLGAEGLKPPFCHSLTASAIDLLEAKRLELAQLRRHSPFLPSPLLSVARSTTDLPRPIPGVSPSLLASRTSRPGLSLSQLPGGSMTRAASALPLPPTGLAASPLPLPSALLEASSTSSTASRPASGGEAYQVPSSVCYPERAGRQMHACGSPLLSGAAVFPSASPAASPAFASLSSLTSVLSPLFSENNSGQATSKGVDDRQALVLRLHSKLRAPPQEALARPSSEEKRLSGAGFSRERGDTEAEPAGATSSQSVAEEPEASRSGPSADGCTESPRPGVKDSGQLDEGRCSPSVVTQSEADGEPAKNEERGTGREANKSNRRTANALNPRGPEIPRDSRLHGDERSQDASETPGPPALGAERQSLENSGVECSEQRQRTGWSHENGAQVDGKEVPSHPLVFQPSRDRPKEASGMSEPHMGLSVSGGCRHETSLRWRGGDSAAHQNIYAAGFRGRAAFMRVPSSAVHPPAALSSAVPSSVLATGVAPAPGAALGTLSMEGVGWAGGLGLSAAGASPPGAVRTPFLASAQPSGLNVQASETGVNSPEGSNSVQGLSGFSPPVSPAPLYKLKPSPEAPFPQHPAIHSSVPEFSPLPPPSLFPANDACGRPSGSALAAPTWWGLPATRGTTPLARDVLALQLSQMPPVSECFLEQSVRANRSLSGVQTDDSGRATNFATVGFSASVGAVCHRLSAGCAIEQTNGI